LADLARTPLYDLHRELAARMVPFAGFELPLHYAAGIVSEHRLCREAAALFDVSHMGQVWITGPKPAAALERLVPADITGLAPGRCRYTMFTSAAGGILDDLIVGREADGSLFVVVNAARRAHDLAHLRAGLGSDHRVELIDDRTLLALQGPKAETVLRRLLPGVEHLAFMQANWFPWDGCRLRVSRSGYTGEDGFEISVPAAEAVTLARRLLEGEGVQPAGLGARDSLRLEAGLCLYGHDIDETTTPVEAGLAWTIAARRRQAGDFPGASVILAQLRDGPPRRRVGLEVIDRVPVREGAALRLPGGEVVGRVTSGGFGPTVGRPIAMGYVAAAHASPGTILEAEVRSRPVSVRVTRLPFVPHRYVRASSGEKT
jgi:aminomethyltransferase